MVFGNSLVVLLVIAALAVYGFLASQAGRSMFGGSTGPLPGATVSG
jgi:hypothetical protein